MRGWSAIVTGLVGLTLTLGVLLWLDIAAAARRSTPEVAAPETARLSFGAEAPAGAESVFPFERHVVHGETQWLPLLLQLADPELLESDKRVCITQLAALPEDEYCRVEYSYWLDTQQPGRVVGVEARVLAGAGSACVAYVECRLPGLAGVRLAVPPGELLARPTGLRITDKVTHATRRPTAEDEAREIAEIIALLATPKPADLHAMPAAQRFQDYFDQRGARRLEALQRRRGSAR